MPLNAKIIPMKAKLVFSLVLILLIAVSCSHRNNRVIMNGSGAPQGQALPPGQMKKVTGSKSARPFAPGQQKKQQRGGRVIIRN
jgi:hypothetical protein